MSKGNGAGARPGNRLCFGDNLDWLPKIDSESVDLVYLDPPFNSNANYSVLFRSPVGEDASSQIQAFEDTWSWGTAAENGLDRTRELSLDTWKLLDALRRTFLGESDIMAYLAMMAPRLLEMRRVMKPSATLYLHCDPNASHYLKILLDCVFEGQGFINEISWKRTTAKSDYAQGATHYPRVRDILLVFRRDATSDSTFNQQFSAYDESYISKKYRLRDEDGRPYQLDNITGPGGAAKGNPIYEVMGVSRYWRYSRERMNDLISKGLIVQPRPGAVPRFKRYLDTMPGVTVSDDWGDIRPINSQAKERLHYPTQKPLQLLERIVRHQAMRVMSSLILSAGAGPRFTRLKSSVGAGSESISRIWRFKSLKTVSKPGCHALGTKWMEFRVMNCPQGNSQASAHINSNFGRSVVLAGNRAERARIAGLMVKSFLCAVRKIMGVQSYQ